MDNVGFAFPEVLMKMVALARHEHWDAVRSLYARILPPPTDRVRAAAGRGDHAGERCTVDSASGVDHAGGRPRLPGSGCVPMAWAPRPRGPAAPRPRGRGR